MYCDISRNPIPAIFLQIHDLYLLRLYMYVWKLYKVQFTGMIHWGMFLGVHLSTKGIYYHDPLFQSMNISNTTCIITIILTVYWVFGFFLFWKHQVLLMDRTNPPWPSIVNITYFWHTFWQQNLFLASILFIITILATYYGSTLYNYWLMRHWIWCDIDQIIPILTKAKPSSILIFSGWYHIIFSASLVNNCFII